MSEYTPSTEEVRNGYANAEFEEVSPRHQAEFDRWLASERARIWDEGYDAGFDRALWGDQPAANPYRKGGDA